MPSRLHTTSARLHALRCVGCGYDGALLDRGRAARCARCGCDLRARPARSYAQMEGLEGVGDAEPAPRTIDPRPEQHRVERCLAAVVLLLALAIAALVMMG